VMAFRTGTIAGFDVRRVRRTAQREVLL